MPGFKSQFSQFPRFAQQGGVVFTPSQIPTQNIPQQMPPSSPPPPPPPPSYSQPFIPPQRKSPFKKILLILVIIILLSGIGILGVLSTRIWDPMWNPFRPAPETVFKQSISKMKNIKKYGYKTIGSLALNATDQNSETANANISLNSSGIIDISDILSPKFDSVFDLILDLSTSNPKENIGLSVSGEARGIDNNFYFKIGKLEARGAASEDLKSYISSFGAIKDVWAKVTKEQVMSLFGQSQNENQIKAIFDNYPIWKTTEQLNDEKIKEENVYHYIIMLDKESLGKAFSEALKAVPNFDYFLGAVEGVVNTFLEKIGEVKADIWIGKKDLLVYKIDFKKAIDLKQVIETIAGNLSLNFNLELSNHNQPVQVNIPPEAKDYEEIFGPLMKKAEINVKNAKIKANLDQLALKAKSMFDENKSYSGLNCKLKDVDVLCSDIKTQNSEDPKVFGYYKKYCAYSKLLKTDDADKQEYYCVDYNLSAAKTDIDPSLKGYCTGWTFECPKVSVIFNASPSPSPSLAPSPTP